MTTIIGVRFKSNGKMYYFDPQGVQVTAGTDVIVDTARGLEYGSCVQGNTEVPEQSVVQPLRRMVRIATDADRKTCLLYTSRWPRSPCSIRTAITS